MGESSAAAANGIPPSREGRGDVRVFARSARRRIWADGAARWVVGAGGVGVIASILGILVFLVVEVLPLFRSARVELARSIPLSGAPPEALVVDEHRLLVPESAPAGAVEIRLGATAVWNRALRLKPRTRLSTHSRAVTIGSAEIAR